MALAIGLALAVAGRAQINLLGVKEGDAATKQKAASAGPVRKDFKPPGPPANGPAPFLTEAVDWDIAKYSKFSEHLVYPTKNKTDAPFYDVPFAVHVPFEVPFDGGSVSVFFDVNIVWDEPEQKTIFRPPGSDPRPLFPVNGGGWNFYQQGIYRIDGATIPPDTVVWEVDGSESRPMTWQTDAPFPLLLNGQPPTPAQNGSVTTSIAINSTVSTEKPRRPFTNARDEHGGFAPNRPLVLRPAKPGWYALWFALSPKVWAWPPKPLHGDDTLHATIYVHTMVARRERFDGKGDYFTPVDLEYLWVGADKQPARSLDPKLVQLHTVQIPLVLRHDGWEFVRAEVRRARPANDFLDRKLPPRESGETTGAVVEASVQPNARGVTATYASSVFVRQNRSNPFPRQPVRSAKMTWDVTFPTEVLDGGAGVVVATGGLTKQGGDEAFRQRKPDDFIEDYLPRWIERPGHPEKDPRGVMTKSMQ